VLWRHLLLHAISRFETNPKGPSLTREFPQGQFDKPQLAFCSRLYDEANTRNDTLVEKAVRLLSLCAVISPLLISALVYSISAGSLTTWMLVLTIGFDLVAVAFVVLAFVVALRAVLVRTYDRPSHQAIVDVAKGEILSYSHDRHARLLLWCTLRNTATNDHIADFVRGGHLFLSAAIALGILGGVPAVASMMKTPSISENSPSELVQSIVSLAENWSAIEQRTYTNQQGVEHLRNQIQSLERELSRLQHDIRKYSIERANVMELEGLVDRLQKELHRLRIQYESKSTNTEPNESAGSIEESPG